VFRSKLQQKQVCLGTCISINDAAVTEALSEIFDFVWIDMEHTSLSLQSVESHVRATRANQTASLVRVAWNDPVLIKPVLDLGASGVIVPMVLSAQQAADAISACRYPPKGIRGFGPLRASRYGRIPTRTFCAESDRTLMTVIQIEHIDAVNHLDEILKVPGVDNIVIGPNDLAASMGHLGETTHPQVRQAIDTIVKSASAAGVNVGMATGEPAQDIAEWAGKGIGWFSLLNDALLLLEAADTRVRAIRKSLSEDRRP